MFSLSLAVCLGLVLQGIHCGQLSVCGQYFCLGGEKVFLSGTNEAWDSYAYDFGNGQYSSSKSTLEGSLSRIHNAGGNSNRIWIHIDGQNTPHFSGSGTVDACDEQGTFIDEVKEYLEAAARNNVLIFLTLWNGAAKDSSTHDRLDGLIKDPAKLQTYIDNCLKPWVQAVKDMPGLGGWDVINEPGGEMIPGTSSSNECSDTTAFANSGMGWEGELYTAPEIQRFVNLQAAAIKSVDSSAVVSLGVWNPIPNTDAFGYHDLYKDTCLVGAGGESSGTMDYYQMHTYAWGGDWDGNSPFQHDWEEFLSGGKPIVIGEFREADAAGMSISELYNHAYDRGYAGAWTWSVTDSGMDVIVEGLQVLKGKTGAAGKVDISL